MENLQKIFLKNVNGSIGSITRELKYDIVTGKIINTGVKLWKD